MLIALDIGNNHVTIGGFDGDDIRFVAPALLLLRSGFVSLVPYLGQNVLQDQEGILV